MITHQVWVCKEMLNCANCLGEDGLKEIFAVFKADIVRFKIVFSITLCDYYYGKRTTNTCRLWI